MIWLTIEWICLIWVTHVILTPGKDYWASIFHTILQQSINVEWNSIYSLKHSFYYHVSWQFISLSTVTLSKPVAVVVLSPCNKCLVSGQPSSSTLYKFLKFLLLLLNDWLNMKLSIFFCLVGAWALTHYTVKLLICEPDWQNECCPTLGVPKRCASNTDHTFIIQHTKRAVYHTCS